MLSNDYTGVIDPTLATLIRRRGKRARLNNADIEDLQQIVAPKLAQARFDPQRAAVTLAVTIIDRQIRSMLRTRYSRRKHIHRMIGAARPQQAPAGLDAVDLRLDLDSALRTLSPRHQEICQGLLRGLSKRAIAAQLGCSAGSVDSVISRIRRKFAAAGLGAWIGESGRDGGKEPRHE